ncbi:MAG: ATPase P [Tepidiforma sp.]|nr:heavy metal translocating P-type ATPase [Tepidiforma sp.]GIW17914.1 MAG: ATPase P [Tepidiforma sp.]
MRLPRLQPAAAREARLPAATVAGTAIGLALFAAGYGRAADVAWSATALGGLVPALRGMVEALRARRAGVDVVAVLAIAGAIALGETLAAAVIGVMLATGQALEAYAAGRAERELTGLLARAPRTARRITGGAVEVVPAEAVRAGDLLLVATGDTVPVDGTLLEDQALLDESALTGESRLAEARPGQRIASGAVNAGAPFRLRALATAGESTYAGIIRLVEAARASRSPMTRLADRYAGLFVPVVLLTAGGAWAWSGDPVRALAVLVVATPCPLILAAPIAIVGGISRAAARGVVIKGGGALETLARVQVVFFDKTGTLTAGTPRLERVLAAWGGLDPAEALRLAASLAQVSGHIMSEALVRAAAERGIALSLPGEVREEPGMGLEGEIDGRRLRLGRLPWVCAREPSPAALRLQRRALRYGGSATFLGVDGELAAAFALEDPVRPESGRVVRMLRRLGIGETVMLTGDHPGLAEMVGASLGIDRVLAGLTPPEKVDHVAARAGAPALMVGDGINDAPALAAADVGVAMGARGAAAAAEAADGVIMVDRLDRLVEAMLVARSARRIAVESIVLGMGLSFLAMGFAAAGRIPPVAGALLQEGIDVAAILNALRVLRWQPPRPGAGIPPAVLQSLLEGHRELGALADELRTLAAELDALPPAELAARAKAAAARVRAMVVPHEQQEERDLYPALAARLPGPDPLAAHSRTQAELFRVLRNFERLASDLEPGAEALDPEDVADLRQQLIGLATLLRLNLAQEEDLAALLGLERAPAPAPAAAGTPG